jgi:hypothetical protein
MSSPTAAASIAIWTLVEALAQLVYGGVGLVEFKST